MDKEKRLIRFLLASSLVMLAFLQIQSIRNPPQPEADGVAAVDGDNAIGEVDVAPGLPGDATENEENQADNAVAVAGDDPPGEDIDPSVDAPVASMVLGSLDPTSPYQMAVYVTNRGAAIQRIELNNPRYQDLDDRSGYLGFLGLTDDPQGGCRVHHVAPASPASDAGLTAGGEPGSGDRIVQVNDIDIADAEALRAVLAETDPGDAMELTVMRQGTSSIETRTQLTATLVKRPLSLISPEPETPDEGDPRHPLSFLWTLGKVGNAKVGTGKDEIANLPSLHDATWAMRRLPAEGEVGEGVEFTRRLTRAELSTVGGKVPLEMVKRFRLTQVDRSDEAVKADPHGLVGYGIKLEMEIRNLGTTEQKLAYQLDGPTGLPLEGWWYSYKVHPKHWSGAGARDVVFANPTDNVHKMHTGSSIAKEFLSEENNKYQGILEAPTRLNYLGCDAQYFTVALVPPALPEGVDPLTAKQNRFASAVSRPVGPVDEKKYKRTDVSYRATSSDFTIAGGEAFKEEFTIFAGPKEPAVLKPFGLEKCIVYGWFGAVAKPMIGVLHFFHGIGLSWGLSIVALTVLVRLCMYPIGRKMAMNAQKMQELAPEMKKIADKYKDNLEKRSSAQQELFKAHNYNPAAGCLMMPLQMPIFVGLYRGLSVDIGLRQAPFFEGMSWCSNLAGPDKFWHWEHVVPAFLGSPEGFLGPFLNVLPFITVILFLVQQILFTPPPQDENQATQQTVMKFMMIFMGIMFHKVAAGLCIYMIASSLWGIAERKLLPKTQAATAGGPGGGSVPSSGPPTPGNGGFLASWTKKISDAGSNGVSNRPSSNGNGASRSKKKKKKKRRK